MNIMSTAKKIASAALFFAALLVLLGGYLASYTTKSGLLLVAGIALGIIFIFMAAVLGDLE